MNTSKQGAPRPLSIEEMYNCRPRLWWLYTLIVLLVVLLLGWSAGGVNYKGIASKGAEVARGIGNGLIHPDLNLLLGRIRKKRDGALHRGIAYLLLEKADCRVSASVHEGKWSWMSPALSDETVEVPVFEMVIHHGAGPVDASYAYAEIPGKSFRHARKAMRRVTLLENTKHRQSVRIDGKDLTVQWEPFSLSIR